MREQGGVQGGMSTGQVARRLGVSQTYVLRLINKGKLAAIRTPLGFLVTEKSVEEYERNRA